MGLQGTSPAGAGVEPAILTGASEKYKEIFSVAKGRRRQILLSQLPIPLVVLQWPFFSQAHLQPFVYQIPKHLNS